MLAREFRDFRFHCSICSSVERSRPNCFHSFYYLKKKLFLRAFAFLNPTGFDVYRCQWNFHLHCCHQATKLIFVAQNTYLFRGKGVCRSLDCRWKSALLVQMKTKSDAFLSVSANMLNIHYQISPHYLRRWVPSYVRQTAGSVTKCGISWPSVYTMGLFSEVLWSKLTMKNYLYGERNGNRITLVNRLNFVVVVVKQVNVLYRNEGRSFVCTTWFQTHLVWWRRPLLWQRNTGCCWWQ